jgi:hypothetical protein
MGHWSSRSSSSSAAEEQRGVTAANSASPFICFRAACPPIDVSRVSGVHTPSKQCCCPSPLLPHLDLETRLLLVAR